MVSRGGGKAPAFDGRSASFLDYANHVHLRTHAARAELAARASLLILHMRPAPCQVCLVEGSAILDHSDGVSKIFDILRNYLAP